MFAARPFLAAALTLAAVSTAQAAPITHDAKAEFATYNSGTLIRPTLNDSAISINSFRGTQGQQNNNTVVPNNRSDIDNMFTPEGGVFYSMGIGTKNLDPRSAAVTAATAGTLSLTINPNAGRRITGGSFVEITNTGSDRHAEALWVFLGTESNAFAQLIGLVWTEDADPTSPFNAGVYNHNNAIATLSAQNSTTGDGGRFSFTVNSGNFTTISFFDASRASYVLPITGHSNATIMNTWSTSLDGFDIDQVSITSDRVPVSEPASLALIGAGLTGLGLLRRRKA
jgi:hypothetical protein